MTHLTDSQRKTYDFIRKYINEHGYAPKMTEIADGIQIRSKGTVHRYVQSLVDANLIRIEPLLKRGISLVKETLAPHSLPLLGTIAAGRPIEAIPGQETFNVTSWFEDQNLYALKVKGDSMIEAGILEGDTVICRQSATAETHEIAVVLVDNNEATLKYCKVDKSGTVTLIPANAALTPQTFAANRVQIQGVVVAQLRQYK